MLSGDKRLTVPTALGIADNSKLNTEVEILKSPSVLLPVFEYVKLDKKNNGDNIKKFYFSKWFEKNLSIRLERGTTVLKINYRDTDKKRIINSLDKIIKEYQDFPQRTKINQLDREIEYLEKQYLIQKEIARISSEKVQRYILKNNLQLRSKTSQLGFENPFMTKSKIETELLKTKYAINKFNEVKFDNEKLFIFSNSLKSSIAPLSKIRSIDAEIVLNELKYKKDDISITFLKETRLKLFDVLRNNVQTYLDIEMELIKKAKLITDIWSEDVLIEYTEISRNAKREEAILNDIEGKLRISKIQKAKSAVPWELITKPTIKDKPVWPPRKLIVLPFGLILGLFFTFAYISRKEKKSLDFDE